MSIYISSVHLLLMLVHLAELLRKSSEHTLVDMVQLLFSRLPQFKEDPKWATNVRKVCCFDACLKWALDRDLLLYDSCSDSGSIGH